MPAAERNAFVREQCHGDNELEREVGSLLSASDEADAYFDGLAGRAGMTTDGANDTVPAAADLKGRRLGSWTLGRLLGRGGMGAVYMAQRNTDDFEQRGALKLLPMGAAANPEARRRFSEERRILARLEHPNIARLLDGGVAEDGTPYFVMEYVEGAPITDYCDERSLPVEDRLHLFLDVCEAVAFAHRSLVIHRDLKPSNIFITKDRTAKLLDFGIAKLVQDKPEANAPATRIMTPAYASPEQLLGETITTASDVYSLGVVLYELLTGLAPYDLKDRSAASVLKAVLEENVSTPSARLQGSVTDRPSEQRSQRIAQARQESVRGLKRRLRGDLDKILLMSLRKDPSRRYVSVAYFADDVRRFLSGFPIRARGESLAYTTSRFLRRNKVAAIGASMGLLMLIALVVASFRFAVVTSQQAAEVARERDRAQEISAFLADLFELTNPASNEGESITARQLLDRGALRVRTQVSDPHTRASMMSVLGEVYYELGLDASSLDLLSEAIETLREADGQSEQLATLLMELGVVQRDGGDVHAALATLRESLAMFAQLPGNHLESEAKVRFHMGSTLHHTGDMAESETQFRQSVELFRKQKVRLSKDYANALYLLGEFLSVKGEDEGVEQLYNEAIQIFEELGGRVQPELSPLLAGLGWYALRQDNLELAEKHFTEAVNIDRQLYQNVHGGSHVALANSLGTLGRFLGNFPDRQAESEALLRESLAMFEEFDTDQDMQGIFTNDLANMLRAQGKNADAIEMYQAAVGIFRGSFGPGSMLEANSLVALGELLAGEGDNDAAARSYREALAAYRNFLPDDHEKVVGVQQALVVLANPQSGP